MKKYLSLALALVLCVMCFAGCGGVNNDFKKPKAEKGDTVVEVWSGEGGAKAVWEELVDNWNDTVGREKKIFIKWKVVMDASQLDVAFQNGNLPDIIAVGSKTQMTQIREKGALISLNEMPGGEEFLKEYDLPGVEGVTMFDGKRYGVQKKATTSAMAINVDLFKEAGIVDDKGNAKAPTTIAELRDAAKKIQALGKNSQGKKVYGFAFPLKFGIGWTIDAMTAPSFSLDDPLQVTDLDKLTITYPGFKDRYQWILDMKKDGTLVPGAETLDNDKARALFAEGTVGMIPAVSWDVGVYTTQFPAKCEWQVCDFPILDGHQKWRTYTSQGGSMSLSRKSAESSKKMAEAMMEVYKFIYSLETRSELYRRGIELSVKRDVLEAVPEEELDPHLVAFAKLVDEDFKAYPSEVYVTEGDPWATMFQKVWAGNMKLEDAIKDMEKRATAGLRAAVEKQTYDVEKQRATEELKRADFEAWKAKQAQK